MGSISDPYSVQKEARKLLGEAILQNSLLPPLPSELDEAVKLVQFTGHARPSIPINWRLAESVSVLKAFEASMLNVLRSRKYNEKLSEVSINTDHASLFIMSLVLCKVVEPDRSLKRLGVFDVQAMKDHGFKDQDLHSVWGTLQRSLTTNIYRTKDKRFYHIHGSMNPQPTLSALGLSLWGEEDDTADKVVDRIQKAVEQHDALKLDEMMNEKYHQAGTIAWSVDEFRASEHGKANSHASLYELARVEGSRQPASWWPEHPSAPSSPQRPLAGLKVVDLTRMIAAPTITRSLAEMGASVMRVTSPDVTDHWTLHSDLNWGKWTCHLDLKKSPEDREKLAELIRNADVVVDGYRPGAMARNGFGREDVFELVKDRGRGIVHVRENCYGWHGPWAHRSGWQQISDACCGVSLAYGRAMGVDEAVTPGFPNSDYCTGIVGCVGVLHALIRRAEEGGSYSIDVSSLFPLESRDMPTSPSSSLNYYSQWLVNSVGTYNSAVWKELWQRHDSPVYRHYHTPGHTIPDSIDRLEKYDKEHFFSPDFFERRTSEVMGHQFVHVKPVAQFKEDVQLGFRIGCRPNGCDEARWPEDLNVQVVK